MPPSLHLGGSLGEQNKAMKELIMKKKKNRLPPFTPTDNKLIDSDLYKKLTNATRVAYLLLCRQRKSFNQTDVMFPYSHAAKYMDHHTWGKAVKDLIAAGLIVKRQEGGLYRKKNIYTLLGISIRGVEKHSVDLPLKCPTRGEIHSVGKANNALTL